MPLEMLFRDEFCPNQATELAYCLSVLRPRAVGVPILSFLEIALTIHIRLFKNWRHSLRPPLSPEIGHLGNERRTTNINAISSQFSLILVRLYLHPITRSKNIKQLLIILWPILDGSRIPFIAIDSVSVFRSALR
jgi:hypothetical protein